MREYILETARNLRGDHHDATIDEIAATAGIDASQIYDYFRSLDELYGSLADTPVPQGVDDVHHR